MVKVVRRSAERVKRIELSCRGAKNFFGDRVNGLSYGGAFVMKQRKTVGHRKGDPKSSRSLRRMIFMRRRSTPAGMVVQTYSELNKTKRSLGRANSELNKTKRSLDQANSELNKTKRSLDQANQKYRELTGSQIPALKANLANQEKIQREASAKVIELRRELAEERRLKVDAEGRAKHARNTLSFLLGSLLIKTFTTREGFYLFPKRFFCWWLEVRRRSKRKKNCRSKKTRHGKERSASKMEVKKAGNKEQIVPSIINRKIDLNKLNVACVVDTFTEVALSYDLNLKQLCFEGWREELNEFKLDLLFVESAWLGKDGKWHGKISHCGNELEELVVRARKMGVPSVFWNKEDPVHFETFINTARLFDYVFTTDIDCVPRYKALLGHQRVYLLPFAAQPKVNNPIEKYEREDGFCFAGAYYLKYPKRIQDLESMVFELSKHKVFDIYDRNYSKVDERYTFPEEYRSFIKGNLPFDQIDRAYKGYKYGINLNTIQQSQTMFARRVFELLASNTVVISNFAQGIRALFGDLVPMSDRGEQLAHLVDRLEDDGSVDKLRLAALRKVMSEHTYTDRWFYILSKVSRVSVESYKPAVIVFATIQAQAEMETILAAFERQSWPKKRLLLFRSGSVELKTPGVSDFEIINAKSRKTKDFARLTKGSDYCAFFSVDDYYGPNYLTDLCLATRYTDYKVIGKAAYFYYGESNIKLQEKDEGYKQVSFIPANRSLVHHSVLSGCNVLSYINGQCGDVTRKFPAFSVDSFNYCARGNSADIATVRNVVDDITCYSGQPMDELQRIAEAVLPASNIDVTSIPAIRGEEIYGIFGEVKNSSIITEFKDGVLSINSQLGDEEHAYIYSRKYLSVGRIMHEQEETVFWHLDVSLGLNVQLACFFLDESGERLSHQIHHSNRNSKVDIPPSTDQIMLGLRVYGPGSAIVNSLYLGEVPGADSPPVPTSDVLLITNNYPTYDNLYSNAFVHRRVLAYKEANRAVDVLCFDAFQEKTSYYEFDGVSVVSGSAKYLEGALKTGRYKKLLIHFLNGDEWDVIEPYVNDLEVFVWLHGADIQKFYHREFAYKEGFDHKKMKSQALQRERFWGGFLQALPGSVRLIFVSQYLADQTMQDYGVNLDSSAYSVIPNPIDDDLFRYQEKSGAQRKKILSIRPFASKIYANDLTVKAIQLLRDQPWFSECEFRIIGDGRFFDEVLEPIKEFPNVILEKRYLSQKEISELHKNYGVFMCPSRMDTHGVSRDEAMSSGLVPITNEVGAIPEFVDDTCAVVAAPDDAEGLANAVRRLIEDEDLFSSFSVAASKNARKKCSKEKILQKEIELIGL